MRKTLLIVEDEKRMLILLKLLFTSNGFEVLTAKDGEEGLNVFIKNNAKISMVISDIGLPKLTGEAMFIEMKKVNQDVKLIFTSGNVEPLEKSTLLKKGVSDFFSKPYDPEHLLKKVKEITGTSPDKIQHESR
ncbi:MAG: response regulator [Bacteroidetes bacterium]|nr:response regulator [Bacteroidota bacterium]